MNRNSALKPSLGQFKSKFCNDIIWACHKNWHALLQKSMRKLTAKPSPMSMGTGWLEARRSISYDFSGRIYKRKKGAAPDSSMRPIRGIAELADIAVENFKQEICKEFRRRQARILANVSCKRSHLLPKFYIYPRPMQLKKGRGAFRRLIVWAN